MYKEKRKFLSLGAGLLAMFLTGLPHLWSIYQPYVMEGTDWTISQVMLCFYLSLITFAFGNLIGGKIQDRYKPSYAIWIGGAIFTFSLFSSVFAANRSLIGLYIGYAFQGIGHGMIYTTVISVYQKWFPARPGFASGLAVTANAMCGFLLAPPSRSWLENYGASTTFLILGILVATSWLLGGLFIKLPENYTATTKASSSNDLTTKEMMRTKEFYILFGIMIAALLSYFLISPMAYIIQESKGILAEYAIYAVMIGPIANAACKLLLPTLGDELGRLRILQYDLMCGIIGLLLIWLGAGYLSSIGIVLVYASYGGVLGIFPSITSQYFGIKYQGQNYGAMLFGFSITAVIAPVTHNFMPGNTYIYAGILSIVIAIIFLRILRKQASST
ncbi:MFS transporter [Candidatus Epulonipiscium viviparus]|uniref:MFS transporter n=1 Tax=Candidatus Epulonipiscium viviparus TaxID=420336 RepID=UPI00273804D1|nr:MFS transporter [Candidatus Epulopiscium viviparus]